MPKFNRADWLAVIAIAACVIVIALALVGCGGGDQPGKTLIRYQDIERVNP